MLADGFGLDFTGFGGRSQFNVRLLPAEGVEERLSAWRAGLLAELCWSECGAALMEFYGKSVLFSALIILLQRAGKSFSFRADWCLQEGCFSGWLTDWIYSFF